MVFDKSKGQIARFDGVWSLASPVSVPSGGANVDAEARLAIGEIINAMTATGILKAKD